MAEPTNEEIKQAVKSLSINQPIMKAEKRGRTLTLHLLGGLVVKYSLPAKKKKSTPPPP